MENRLKRKICDNFLYDDANVKFADLWHREGISGASSLENEQMCTLATYRDNQPTSKNNNELESCRNEYESTPKMPKKSNKSVSILLPNNLQIQCQKRQTLPSNIKFTKPRPWSWSSRTFIIIFTLLMAPFLTDVLRRQFTKKYVRDDDGIPIQLPTKHTSSVASACYPSMMGDSPRHSSRVSTTPLVLGQRVPNVSERTIGASGPAEGRIYRSSESFRSKLEKYWRIGVVFKNDEDDHEDRLMTVRCEESLSRLSILVQNRWEGVKVRVTEAWKEEKEVVEDDQTILHYEGRALDITTDDTDHSKYGLLARLAVTAGFDWVYYKSPNYVHCSCKSDSLDEALYKGCFAGDSMVSTPGGGAIPMSQLKAGDKVLAVNKDGEVVTDKILTFMDRKAANFHPELEPNQITQPAFQGQYYTIETETGNILRLTGNHLLFASRQLRNKRTAKRYARNLTNSATELSDLNLTPAKAIFAKRVKVGNYVYVLNRTQSSSPGLTHSKVVSVRTETGRAGAYAPLTSLGTIIVDGTMASCYAVIENHSIAHAVLSPVRFFYSIKNWISGEESLSNSSTPTSDHESEGISWYPKLWFKIGSYVLPSSMFHGF